MAKGDKFEAIDDQIHQLRTLAAEPVFIENIKRHGLNWDLLWAAVDTIEDTQLAIDAYEVGTDEQLKQGEEYLKVYGLFQTMFVQQDAIKHIAEGLKLPKVSIWDDSEASAVRTIRNKYFGHHKHTNKDAPTTYHGISRMTVGTGTIKAWTYPNFSTEEINIKDAISANAKYT
jgi:hypothetical protein